MVLLGISVLLSGCSLFGPREPVFGDLENSQGSSSGNGFRVGDHVTVVFSGNIILPEQSHEERVKDDGTITLPEIGAVKAVGKTTGQLQKEIREQKRCKNKTRLLRRSRRAFELNVRTNKQKDP